MGTTTAQKKLFFNLKKLKNQIAPGQEGDLKDEHVDEISKRLDVNSQEVVNMNRRLMGQEKSLNDPIKSGETDEWQDWLVDKSLDQELVISQKQEYDDKKNLLNDAMEILNEREKNRWRCWERLMRVVPPALRLRRRRPGKRCGAGPGRRPRRRGRQG